MEGGSILSIADQIRGEFEIKSVIEEMYYCRVDELTMQKSAEKEISLKELEKLPKDIAKDILENNAKSQEESLDVDDETENLNKRFYTTGFKDGVNMILESLN